MRRILAAATVGAMLTLAVPAAFADDGLQDSRQQHATTQTAATQQVTLVKRAAWVALWPFMLWIH